MAKLFTALEKKIERASGVIRGASVATSGVEAIGHGFYTDKESLKTIKAAAGKFGDEGLPVKIEHGSGVLATVGTLKNLRIDDASGDGDLDDGVQSLRGDLQLLRTHPAYEQLCEMSETMPGCIGLSIEYSGDHENIGGLNFLRCAQIACAAIVGLGAINPNGLLAAKEPYGDVEYADPGYQSDKKKRYPIDTEEHARAAWSYINKKSNAAEYTADQLAKIKSKIKSALKRFGVKVGDEMSATVDLVEFLNAAENPPTEKNMNPLTAIGDILVARKTFSELDAIINPALTKAGLLQLSVDGTPKPIEDAPIQARLTAFVGLLSAPEGKQREAELIATNALVAGEADTAKKNLSIATATVAGLQVEKSELSSKVTSLESAVSVMTAEKAQMKVQLDAALSEFSRVNGINLGLNEEISKQGLALNAILDLRDEKGNLIPSTATPAEKLAAANRIAPADKLKALGGICSRALLQLGVPSGTAPATPPAGSGEKQPTMKREDFLKLEAKEQTAFLNAKGKITD